MFGYWIQIIALVAFVIGYLIFIGCGVMNAASEKIKFVPNDGVYDVSACIGGLSVIMFLIGVVVNHGLFFM